LPRALDEMGVPGAFLGAPAPFLSPAINFYMFARIGVFGVENW
jgi:hypothetical protein